MASTFVRSATLTKIGTHWTATPIRSADDMRSDAYDNPADGAGFLFVEFPMSEEEQSSIGSPGSNVFVEHGRFRVIYNVPLSTTLTTAISALDTLRGHLRSIRYGTDLRIVTYAPGPVTEPFPFGPYHEIAFTVPYRYFLNG